MVLNQSSLKTFSSTQTRQDNTSRSKTCKHVCGVCHLSRVTARYILLPRVLISVLQRACFHLPYTQTNQPNEAGGCLVEDLVKKKKIPNIGWPSLDMLASSHIGGDVFKNNPRPRSQSLGAQPTSRAKPSISDSAKGSNFLASAASPRLVL